MAKIDKIDTSNMSVKTTRKRSKSNKSRKK